MNMMEKNTHWRKCNGIYHIFHSEYWSDMGNIGILWSG